MRKLIIHGAFVAVALIAFAGTAQATVYTGTNSCPITAQVGTTVDGNLVTRQYQVTDATFCFWDSAAVGPLGNLQGNGGELTPYLSYLPAGVWQGGGQESSQAGATSGSFNFVPPVGYNQLLIALKDGSFPFWAMFVMPVGDFASNWAFLSQGGALSHFALYWHQGGGGSTGGGGATVPEPAALGLFALGLFGAAGRLRKRLV